MAKTYAELQKELLSKTQSNEKLKQRVTALRSELAKSKVMQQRLIVSYEKVVKEWQHMYKGLLDNAWKLLFAKVHNRVRGI